MLKIVWGQVWIVLIVLIVLTMSCGQQSSSDSEESFTGPSIAGSSYSGAYFTAISKDSTNDTAYLFWYDFASGQISRVSSQSGRDPVVFASTSGKRITFLTRSQLNYQTFQIESGAATSGKSGTLSGPTAGDPTAWYDSSSSEMILASSHEGSVRVFDPSTNYLGSKISAAALDLSDIGGLFAPVHLNSYGSSSWVFTSAVNVNAATPTAAGYGHAVSMQKGDSWSFSKNKTLTVSHPVFSYSISSGVIRTVGLCRTSFGSSCKQGVSDVNATSGAVTKLSDLSGLNYEYFSSIVSGSDESYVYAHVKSKADSTYKIIKINLTSGTAEEVVSLADDSLYLLYYDASSQRLFVGNVDSGEGVLEVYKSAALEGRVKLKLIPRQMTVYK
jgi:hypothetical protein